MADTQPGSGSQAAARAMCQAEVRWRSLMCLGHLYCSLPQGQVPWWKVFSLEIRIREMTVTRKAFCAELVSPKSAFSLVHDWLGLSPPAVAPSHVGKLGRPGNAESHIEASAEEWCRPGLNWEELGDSEENGRHSSLEYSLVQPSQGLSSCCNWWGME